MVYDVATPSVKYMSPSVDFDTSPMWMADSKHLIFMRQPGLPFGQQTLQVGAGSGAAYAAPPQSPAPATGGRGGGRGAAAAPGNAETPVNKVPGIMRATFQGGYTISFYKADVTTGDAQEIWHNQPNDKIAGNIGNPRLAGDFVIFQLAVPGGRGGRGGRGRGGRGLRRRIRSPAVKSQSTNGIATTQ